jgi:hypothetical protein
MPELLRTPLGRRSRKREKTKFVGGLGDLSYEPDPSDSVPYGCGREWHRNGEILRRPHARRIYASVKDYAARVASGSKRK